MPEEVLGVKRSPGTAILVLATLIAATNASALDAVEIRVSHYETKEPDVTRVIEEIDAWEREERAPISAELEEDNWLLFLVMVLTIARG